MFPKQLTLKYQDKKQKRVSNTKKVMKCELDALTFEVLL